ncbi:MAG: hypothetical protein QOC85_2508, partial [Streptomyces sp.]|nr:hypothetical protein [Streptomyces sp.]
MAGDALAVVDTHGIVTGWSEGACLLTGFSAREVSGLPVSALVDGNAVAVWRSLRRGGGSVVAVRRQDGRRAQLALRVCPLHGAQGLRAGYVITAAPEDRDRTLGELAFRQAPLSMSVFDTEQRYLRVNDAACRAFGLQEAELRGRFFPETVENAEHSRGFLRHLRKVVETGRPVHYESWTNEPTGLRRHAWNSELWPLRDPSGQVLGVALAA